MSSRSFRRARPHGAVLAWLESVADADLHLSAELRAVTGADYGRIWDHELVAAVMKIAGNGAGDTRWKVPGVLD
jgi:hypothetical protein